MLQKTTRWESARWELEPLEALALHWAEMAHPEAAALLNQAALRWHGLAEWSRAEPLMRRVVHILEVSLGKEHPNVATALNNLAGLLKATHRLAEAEPLMRRMLEIFLKFTVATGHSHPHLQPALGNYAGLLEAMSVPADEIYRRLNDLLGRYGMGLG